MPSQSIKARASSAAPFKLPLTFRANEVGTLGLFFEADGSPVLDSVLSQDTDKAEYVALAVNAYADNQATIAGLVAALEATVNQLVFTLAGSTSDDAWRGITADRAQSIKTTLEVARAALAKAKGGSL